MLLLLSGCLSDDKRNEAEDDDSNVSCVHCPGVLLKRVETVNESDSNGTSEV